MSVNEALLTAIEEAKVDSKAAVERERNGGMISRAEMQAVRRQLMADALLRALRRQGYDVVPEASA